MGEHPIHVVGYHLSAVTHLAFHESHQPGDMGVNQEQRDTQETKNNHMEIIYKIRTGLYFPNEQGLGGSLGGERLTSRIQRLKGRCQESFLSRCR